MPAVSPEIRCSPAARRAAREQKVAGETAGISYETSDGRWHEELSEGDDRPDTEVTG